MFSVERITGLLKGVASGRSTFGLVLHVDGEAVGEFRPLGQDVALIRVSSTKRSVAASIARPLRPGGACM
jgi:hypothetical protein